MTNPCEMCKTALAERDAKIQSLRCALHNAWAIAMDAPELNPSNYDHDQVCVLNTAMIEVWSILNEATRPKETTND